MATKLAQFIIFAHFTFFSVCRREKNEHLRSSILFGLEKLFFKWTKHKNSNCQSMKNLSTCSEKHIRTTIFTVFNMILPIYFPYFQLPCEKKAIFFFWNKIHRIIKLKRLHNSSFTITSTSNYIAVSWTVLFLLMFRYFTRKLKWKKNCSA